MWRLPNEHLGCKITVFCQRVKELTADAEQLFSFLVSFQQLLSLLFVVFDILVNTFEFTLMSLRKCEPLGASSALYSK